MSDGMGREPAYLSSHATNRYFIPNWGNNVTMVAASVIVVSYLHFYQLLSPNIHFVYRFFFEEHLFLVSGQ